MTDILVVAELVNNELRTTSLSAFTFAKTLAEKTSGAWDILCIGAGATAASQEAAAYGARNVYASDIAGGYTAEGYAPTVAELGKKYGALVATASSYGKDLLPRIAARLNAGFVSDVVSMQVDGTTVTYTRPMFAGNVLGSLQVNTAQHVITVRQTEFAPATKSGAASPVQTLAASAADLAGKVEFVSLESVPSTRPELSEASIVVSGGRALKSADNFKTVLEPLVDSLNAAMGASRAACDAGYVPNDLQVGQTGKIVAPKLYIAVGISGAIQHLAGMKGSKVIVAINTDKEAPIVEVADYFWQADLFNAVPALTSEIKKVRS